VIELLLLNELTSLLADSLPNGLDLGALFGLQPVALLLFANVSLLVATGVVVSMGLSCWAQHSAQPLPMDRYSESCPLTVTVRLRSVNLTRWTHRGVLS